MPTPSATIPRHALPATAPPLRVVPLRSFLCRNTDVVHRHDFYELLWIKRGRGTHDVDFAPHPIQDHTLLLLAPGQVHHLRAGQAQLDEALILIFNEEFLVRDAADRELLAALALPRPVPGDALAADPAAVGPVLALLEQHCAQPAPDYELLRTALKLALLTVRHGLGPAAGPGAGTSPASERLRAFRALVEAEHPRWHQVAPYAARLALSSKRLDQLCRAAWGHSAQRLVHERLALEAKRRLAYEPASVKQIAFDLGFVDASYFSRFFRALTGTTPKAFRQQFPNSTRF